MTNVIDFTELNDYFASLDKPPSKSSQMAYKSQYKKIRTEIKKPLLTLPIDEITEYLETIEQMNTKKNLLNIFVMLKRKDYPEDYEYLIALRETYKDEINKVVMENNEKLEATLPTFKQIEKHLRDSNGVDYIINYILFYYFVRSKDLDLIITKELPEDENSNYILINKDGKSVLYHRGNYKTVRTHGMKDHLIKEKKFVSTCLSLLGSKKSVKLLPFKQADKAIRNSTYNGISESEHVKILVHHYFNLKNINKLIKIGQTRGTNLNLVLKNYNLDYQLPKYDFKEDSDEREIQAD